MTAVSVPETTGHRGSALEVLRVFTKLGLTSFGGPVAHLGYFRTEFVERRKWVDEVRYVDIVALCQFLPGPASSQTGISLGILRAGLPGALAAWIGFSGPSALAMILFGYGVARLGDIAHVPWLHGLKIVAVAVVAQAVWRRQKRRTTGDRAASFDRAAAIEPLRARSDRESRIASTNKALESPISNPLFPLSPKGLLGHFWRTFPSMMIFPDPLIVMVFPSRVMSPFFLIVIVAAPVLSTSSSPAEIEIVLPASTLSFPPTLLERSLPTATVSLPVILVIWPPATDIVWSEPTLMDREPPISIVCAPPTFTDRSAPTVIISAVPIVSIRAALTLSVSTAPIVCVRAWPIVTDSFWSTVSVRLPAM